MALINRALNPNPKRWGDWVVLHFQHARAGQPEVQDAAGAARVTVGERLYRFDMFRWAKMSLPADFRKRRVRVLERREFLVDPPRRLVLGRMPGGRWQRIKVPNV
jgi:hypothetical protein